MTECVKVCVRAPVRLYALQAALLACHVSSSIVLRCLRYNERPAAAACTALAAASPLLPSPPPSSSSSSLLHHPLPLSSRPPLLLCYFKWRGALWVLQCLSRACLVTYGGDGEQEKTTTPRVLLGPHQSIRLQHIRGDRVGGGRICRDQHGV